MTIGQILHLIDAQVLVGEEKLDRIVESAFSSDLMSDVLAFIDEDTAQHTALITGLANAHSVRTAELLDIGCIIFSRGKVPEQDVLERARACNLVVLTTRMTMYTVCGTLFSNGLPGAAVTWAKQE